MPVLRPTPIDYSAQAAMVQRQAAGVASALHRLSQQSGDVAKTLSQVGALRARCECLCRELALRNLQSERVVAPAVTAHCRNQQRSGKSRYAMLPPINELSTKE